MEFKDKNQELTFIEEQFNGDPNINVITKEQFEERVYKVFTILWEKLSKSFGPGGAGTFISIYPSLIFLFYVLTVLFRLSLIDRWIFYIISF